ncbi:MAG: hypothetical protein RLZZ08_116 [Pseudomonadota bacterium]|jgi:spore germination cell wall hydrolase CwlJ-like protein
MVLSGTRALVPVGATPLAGVDFAVESRVEWLVRHGLRPLALFALALLASLAAPVGWQKTAGTMLPGAVVRDNAGLPRVVVPPGLAAQTTPDALLPLEAPTAIATNAKRPFDSGLEVMAPFQFALAGADRERAVDCLAAAAWYEAGDDQRGERAVMQVVLNRVRHPSYPRTVCGVVFQGSDRSTGCQFTFTCDGALARTPSPDAWRRAQALANAALSGMVDAEVGGATHYHADYVVPRWAPQLDKLAQVGAHIFYRFPGSWGKRAAFTIAGDRPEPPVGKLARLAPVHAVDGVDMPPMELAGVGDRDAIENAQAGLAAQALRAPIAPSMLPAPPVSSAIIVALDPASPPGRWAVNAMDQCKGRADCQVLAWASPMQADANRMRPAAERERPLFVFVRDRSSRMELALWDCAVAARADTAQCLPTDEKALRRLMRPR